MNLNTLSVADGSDLFVSEIIIATADFDASLQFWVKQIGYPCLATKSTTDASLLKLWQVDANNIGRRALLGQQHDLSHIHLVEVLAPIHPLKQHAGNLDALPKTINLLVKDLPAVWQRLYDKGVTMKTKWVEYENAGERFRDAHIVGPDATGIGLLEALDQDYSVNELGIGAPASFTFTVEDMAKESDFYQQLGGQLQLNQTFSGPAIEELVGLPPGGSLHMKLFGPNAVQSRIELVSYGIPMTSHYHQATFPHTGALFAHIATKKLPGESQRLPNINSELVTTWQSQQALMRLNTPAGATVILCQQ